ncbi:Uncharacterised protein [Klebsiella pneumoniae]|nr:Uncharacterised protein [Klebsiella pneumoniae]
MVDFNNLGRRFYLDVQFVMPLVQRQRHGFTVCAA